MRHFEVAKMLKDLPRDASFLLRVVEPIKSGFANIGKPGQGKAKGGAISNGKATLRLNSKGPASVEVPDDVVDVAIEKINARLESYLGINDNELAQTIWEIGSKMKNPVEFSENLQQTELAMFGFSDEFIFEIWGDIGDAKSGRMVKITQFDEQF
ncbi:GIPC3 [Bugula neritina]|uniref:GIPC3 n=1 Tax=Bugula neritina TaxID=10212 RepID=A0A7J7KSP3_BUGNE|nr:GIPC3 [Bugula neritina]